MNENSGRAVCLKFPKDKRWLGESVNKFIIFLQINLMEHIKNSTSRDFRIDVVSLQSALQEQASSEEDEEEEQQQQQQQQQQRERGNAANRSNAAANDTVTRSQVRKHNVFKIVLILRNCSRYNRTSLDQQLPHFRINFEILIV